MHRRQEMYEAIYIQTSSLEIIFHENFLTCHTNIGKGFVHLNLQNN